MRDVQRVPLWVDLPGRGAQVEVGDEPNPFQTWDECPGHSQGYELYTRAAMRSVLTEVALPGTSAGGADAVSVCDKGCMDGATDAQPSVVLDSQRRAAGGWAEEGRRVGPSHSSGRHLLGQLPAVGSRDAAKWPLGSLTRATQVSLWRYAKLCVKRQSGTAEWGVPTWVRARSPGGTRTWTKLRAEASPEEVAAYKAHFQCTDAEAAARAKGQELWAMPQDQRPDFPEGFPEESPAGGVQLVLLPKGTPRLDACTVQGRKAMGIRDGSERALVRQWGRCMGVTNARYALGKAQELCEVTVRREAFAAAWIADVTPVGAGVPPAVLACLYGRGGWGLEHDSLPEVELHRLLADSARGTWVLGGEVYGMDPEDVELGEEVGPHAVGAYLRESESDGGAGSTPGASSSSGPAGGNPGSSVAPGSAGSTPGASSSSGRAGGAHGANGKSGSG